MDRLAAHSSTERYRGGSLRIGSDCLDWAFRSDRDPVFQDPLMMRHILEAIAAVRWEYRAAARESRVIKARRRWASRVRAAAMERDPEHLRDYD